MSTETATAGADDGPGEDPERDARTARVFAEALARRRQKIARGEHVCPPWPEECQRDECRER
jgi:hypothetical protein